MDSTVTGMEETMNFIMNCNELRDLVIAIKNTFPETSKDINICWEQP